jgi:flagellar hook-associated protein 3 FlgL
MLSDNFLADMRTNMNNLQTIQKQMATQKEINEASDDPTKAVRIMALTENINANVQYNTNINEATNFLDTTDTALGQVGDVLKRVNDLLIQSGNGGYTEQERSAIKDELNVKVGELSQILNTNFDGRYVFGGTKVDVKPMTTMKSDIYSPGPTYKNGAAKPCAAAASLDLTAVPVLSANTNYSVTLTVDATGVVTGATAQSAVNGGTLASTPVTTSAPDGSGNVTLDLGNGVKLNVPKDTANVTGDVMAFTCNSEGNTRLIYNSDNPASPELTDPAKLNQLDQKLYVEVSQGVTLDYNVSASDVLKFTNDKGQSIDLRNVLTKIMNHLDGNTDDGSSPDTAATGKLSTTDKQDIQDTISNLLSIRAKVGAKQNRMDSAKDRNGTENQNLTDVLSKTQDIDITQKTIDYSTAQTVYTAALQTSARIIQPSLLDYLK